MIRVFDGDRGRLIIFRFSLQLILFVIFENVLNCRFRRRDGFLYFNELLLWRLFGYFGRLESALVFLLFEFSVVVVYIGQYLFRLEMRLANLVELLESLHALQLLLNCGGRWLLI